MKTPSLQELGHAAKRAAYLTAKASTQQKNSALQAIAKSLDRNKQAILQANQEDIQAAKAEGLSEAMIDRLSLLGGRLDGMIRDMLDVVTLPDPVGSQFEEKTLPNGLKVAKCRTPIGVLGVIYESRPNVTIDIAALTLKTGNCALLRGGSETVRTNRSLVEAIQDGLKAANLPQEAIQLISSSDRQQVKELLRMHESIDLIIPRGGAGLHQFCRENSTIPVITGGIGICHLFVDETADRDKAIQVIINAKTQRPTVCNALDTILVHEKIAAQFIPAAVNALRPYKVSFRVDDSAALLLKGNQESVSKAGADDWDTEWLSLVLGIKVVRDLGDAVAHIRKHSTGHSDGILTQNMNHGEQFVKEVDSAAVYINASTRFTDGGQLGLGAEVAISTQKLHARGPMGLQELTTYKWIIRGDYHTRA